jgi:hypothetical protein
MGFPIKDICVLPFCLPLNGKMARTIVQGAKSDDSNCNHLKKFKPFIIQFQATCIGILINSSFNVRDEPVVCNPDNVYSYFIHTEMELFSDGNFLSDKKNKQNCLGRRIILLHSIFNFKYLFSILIIQFNYTK